MCAKRMVNLLEEEKENLIETIARVVIEKKEIQDLVFQCQRVLNSQSLEISRLELELAKLQEFLKDECTKLFSDRSSNIVLLDGSNAWRDEKTGT